MTLVVRYKSVYIGVARRFTGEQVVDILEALKAQRGLPQAIRVDNGPELISLALDQWAGFSRPGKPTDNAVTEAFNGRLRQECLNAHWFESLADAQQKIDLWKTQYNQEHPHSALGNLAPDAFTKKHHNQTQERSFFATKLG
jgi:putative transposase